MSMNVSKAASAARQRRQKRQSGISTPTLRVDLPPNPPQAPHSTTEEQRRGSSAYTSLQQMKLQATSPASHLSKSSAATSPVNISGGPLPQVQPPAPILDRTETDPITREEHLELSGKESRLHALAVLRKLATMARPDVGAIVTIDELQLLEDTVRAAAELNAVTVMAQTAELSLQDAKQGENGYLLDEEMYNSLRSYMTVKIEKPADKFRRVARSVKSLASRVINKSPVHELDVERLPEYIENGVARWSFDVIEVEEVANHGALVWVAESLMKKCHLLAKLEVPANHLRCWLVALTDAYKKNSYHNSMHGADVCQTMYCLMENSSLKMQLNNKTKFAALLAAASHDVGHDGFNNNFLINTDDPLAITYHYDSPLEHMHAARAFELMRLPGCDVLSFFDGENLKETRQMMFPYPPRHPPTPEAWVRSSGFP